MPETVSKAMAILENELLPPLYIYEQINRPKCLKTFKFNKKTFVEFSAKVQDKLKYKSYNRDCPKEIWNALKTSLLCTAETMLGRANGNLHYIKVPVGGKRKLRTFW